MSFDVTTLALAKSYADQHGGSGGSGEKEIFKIPVTITELEEPADGESFKVEHTVTLAELDAAVKEGKTPIVLASFGGLTYALPLLYYYSGAYLFYIRVDGSSMSILVGWAGDEGDTPKESWQFMLTGIAAESVSYSNDALPSVTDVRGALDELIPKSHTHANKDTLDKLSVSNGKLQYNSSDILIKSDKQEIVNDVLAALPTWTGGSY